MTDDDAAHLASAIALAARGLGETWPNPSVGCVVVDAAGRVVGRGRTATGGRPHAETTALAAAGYAARGGTAYVSLEPCSHVGQTPPCADALVAAGIARVVAAAGDPDPRVDGRGFFKLREAGLAVELAPPGSEVAQAAARVNAGFVTRVRRGRPLVTLKLASSLDGRIATATGESRWITGPGARREAHRLRATHDAILVGIGTALADDPDLSCRLAGARARPLVRIVADRRLRLPPGSRLASSARETPVWLLHAPTGDGGDPATAAAAAERLRACGVRLLELDGEDMLSRLGEEGLTRLLVEGGGTIAASLLASDAVDRLAWFAAPMAIGGDGLAAVAGFGAASLADAKRFSRLHMRAAGPDMLVTTGRIG